MKRILITGGAGYVGTSLIPQLLAKGYKVRVFDNLSMGGEGMLPFFANKDFEFIKGDITNMDDIKAAVKDVDGVVHLAGIVGYPACRKFPELSRSVNVDGTHILIDALDKNVPIFFASTGSTYGKLIDDICTETTKLNPLTNYGKQKVEGEELLKKRGNFVIYRFATAFGVSPRLRLDLLPNDFTYKALKDKTLIVYEKNFMRTFIHVRDMGRAFVFAIENYDKMKDGIFNVGDNAQNVSKEDVCLLIKKYMDYYLHFADVGKDFDQRDYVVSYDKIQKLGFRCSISIEDGIQEMIRAFEVIEIKTPYSNV